MRDAKLITDREADVFVGPRPLETGERLFGRDREVVALTSLLIGERVVLLYSPSGAGKTSLIQAGLVPALRDEDFLLPREESDPPSRRDLAVVIRMSMPLAAPDANRYVLSTLWSLEANRKPASRWPGSRRRCCPRRLVGETSTRCGW